MRMNHITIQSNKYEESVKFYQEVTGLKITRVLKENNPYEITFLANEEGETEIEIIESSEPFEAGKGLSIGFAVEDVESFREELIERGYEPTPMVKPNPFVKFFFLADPNGVMIQFI